MNENNQYDIQQVCNENNNKNKEHIDIMKLFGKRKRLPVFSNITLANENKKNGKIKKIKKNKKQTI